MYFHARLSIQYVKLRWKGMAEITTKNKTRTPGCNLGGWAGHVGTQADHKYHLPLPGWISYRMRRMTKFTP